MSVGWVNQNTGAYINRLVRQQLYSKQVTARPLFYFLTGQNEKNLQALLASPKTDPSTAWKKGVTLGGGSMGLAQRETMRGSEKVQFRYQKDTPDNGSGVAPGGATPVANKFSEDLVGTAQVGWTLWQWPLKIRQSTIDNLGSPGNNPKTYIASVLEEAVGMSFNQMYTNVQTQFWTGTLTQAQQDQIEWYQNVIGLKQWVSDGTSSGETSYRYVGQVDRTTATQLKSTVLVASDLVSSGYIPSTMPTLDLISKINTIPDLGGIQNRSPGGGDLVITTPQLFNVLRQEAEGQANIWQDVNKPVPNVGTTIGFKLPVIMKDGTYITYDPDCPEGEMYVLSTGSWMYEIRDGYNFMQAGFQDKWRLEEGGQMYVWNLISLKHRLTCLQPWLNVKVKGLTY